MACKALQAMQQARLEVTCPQLSCHINVNLICTTLQWTAQHWSLAQVVSLYIQCSRMMLDADKSQERLAYALRACLGPPRLMRCARSGCTALG